MSAIDIAVELFPAMKSDTNSCANVNMSNIIGIVQGIVPAAVAEKRRNLIFSASVVKCDLFGRMTTIFTAESIDLPTVEIEYNPNGYSVVFQKRATKPPDQPAAAASSKGKVADP